MEPVVFRSDIARLVLGYLKIQNLSRAARIFCETSPHLKEELNAYEQGLQTYSFFPDLEEIICEYVLIKQKADSYLRNLPDRMRVSLQSKKLSEVVNELLQVAIQVVLDDKGSNQCKNANCDVNIPGEVIEIQLNSRKRKRSSSDEKNKNQNSNFGIKRSKIGPFCYLKRGGKFEDFVNNLNQVNYVDANIETDNDSESNGEDETILHKDEHQTSEAVLELNNPKKESTPIIRNNVSEYKTPSVPEMQQVILDNPEFTQRLAQHINDGLKSKSILPVSTECQMEQCSSQAEEITFPNADHNFEDIVKNIISATEKDPELDAIIEELVDGGKKPVTPSKKHCTNLDQHKNETSATYNNRNYPISTDSLENITCNNQIQPRTPLIIRNAVAAGNSISGDIQSIPFLSSNTSFGSLIDPNFSISKLIVLNSNGSAQKNMSDPQTSIGDVTTENLLNQLEPTSIESGSHDQIHLDTTSGQLAFPIFLTNDGLITNFPFLINNEGVIQTLQMENISNTEPARIEISVPEPITVTEDQLPSNLKIFGSTQKIESGNKHTISDDVHHRTANKLKESNNHVTSASVDSRLQIERGTPSTIGIVNVKAFKSLSTPRKRESHVRTLTFSPMSLLPQTVSDVGTPLTTRKLPNVRATKDVVDETKLRNNFSDKPIINNVEIINRLTENTNPDTNSNESGNSCSVPPLFGNEECSNQTIIHCESERNTNLSVTPLKSAETPKRQQTRKMAVRACKLKLSKSPIQLENNGKESKTLQNEQLTNLVTPKKCEAKLLYDKGQTDIKEKGNEQMGIEEWKKLRSLTYNDLDSHLREINSSQNNCIPPKKVPKKRIRRKKNMVVEDKNKEDVANVKKIKKKKCNTTQEVIEPSNEEIVKSGSEKICQRNMKKKQLNIITTSQKHTESKINEKDKCRETLTNQPEQSFQKSPHIESKNLTYDTKNCQKKLITAETMELEKRTANIAHLLETPFKDSILDNSKNIPPTPGILPSSLATPLSKIKFSEELVNSESFLFGSISKSELGTPLQSALTPGFGLNQFSSNNTTPISIVPSEYSSSSSYYKPDEADEYEKNLGRKTKGSEAQVNQASNNKKCAFVQEIKDLETKRKCLSDTTERMQSTSCVNIPVSTLKVEPIILQRVKTIRSDAIESEADLSKVMDPHYKLVSGLPEVGRNEEEYLSSSSSPSKSCTSSSSNTTCSSLCTKKKIIPFKDNNLEEDVSTLKNTSVLDRLSEISSGEDEDWQKLAVTDCEESQLVGTDGEVRYPVRSWLTPNKEKAWPQSKSKATHTISENSRQNSVAEVFDVEKERNQHLVEAYELKETFKGKKPEGELVPDFSIKNCNMVSSQLRQTTNSNEHHADKSAKLTPEAHLTQEKQSISTTICGEHQTIELLNALQLSARKKTTSVLNVIPSPGNVHDDNAMSFSNLVCEDFTAKITDNPANLPNSIVSDTKKIKEISERRKCIQIEPKPLQKLKNIGSRSNNKNSKPRKTRNFNAQKTGNRKCSETQLVKNSQNMAKTKQQSFPRQTVTENSRSYSKVVGSNLESNGDEGFKEKQNMSEKKMMDSVNIANKSTVDKINGMTFINHVIELDSTTSKRNNKDFVQSDDQANIKSPYLKSNSQKFVEKLSFDSHSIVKCDSKKADSVFFTEDIDEREICRSRDIEVSNFFEFVYKGVDDVSIPQQKDIDFDKFSMCVEIDGRENRILTISKEICLHCVKFDDFKMQQIKNIPKKRYKRSGSVDEHQSSNDPQPIKTNVEEFSICEHSCNNDNSLVTTRTLADTTPSNTLYNNAAADKLSVIENIEDIENILSQLHGHNNDDT